MSSVLGSALKALLDGFDTVAGPTRTMADWLAQLGYDVPPAAAPHVEKIKAALPTAAAIDTDQGLAELLKKVTDFAQALQDEPVALKNAAQGYAKHLAATLPERLIGYIAITQAQKRVPLVAGLLRMAGVFSITQVTVPARFDVAGPRYLINLDQLMLIIRDPKAGLRWGQADFNSQAVVWGLEDVINAIRGLAPKAEDERLELKPDDERTLVGRLPDTPSAAAAIDVGTQSRVRIAGLHEKGLVVVPVKVSFTVGLPDSVKDGIDNATGISPDVLDNPGVWIAPDTIGPLPHAAVVLPGA
jgi:hypothetical protein